MSQPRIFVSAASQELRSARLMVRDVLRVLGYEPVSQDDFPTGHGNLLEWLKEQLDTCEGVIQIAGDAYGAEPPGPLPSGVDHGYGRLSYTQFELRYAQRQGKKTWVIFPGSQCKRDRPADHLDLPEDPKHPDPAGYQAERRALQADYLAALRRENHLWHNAADDKDLKLLIHGLRDELGVLRQKSQRQWRRMTVAVGSILVLLGFLTGGGWWAYVRLHKDVQASSAVTTEKIRSHLLKTVEQTHQRELAEAEKEPDWKKRKKLHDAAEAANESRLAQVDQLAASFREIEGRGSASTVFQELTRILATQGVDAALQYMASQRADILTEVRSRAASASARNRADLEPLLKTAELYRSKGQEDKARDVYRDILSVEPNWIEALSWASSFFILQGEHKMKYTTLADAKADIEEGMRLDLRMIQQDPSEIFHQPELSASYDILGDVAVSMGKLDDAERDYENSRAILMKLLAAEPKRNDWEHDLLISYQKLGDVALRRGKLDEAMEDYQDALKIAKKNDAIWPETRYWQRQLMVTYNEFGDVAVCQDKLDDAARDYGDGLPIARKIAASDPNNRECQRDLSVSYGKLGDVALSQGKYDEAARDCGDEIAITKKLAASDPSNSEGQRDLSISYEKTGNVAVRQGRLEEAARDYGNSFTIRKRLVASDPGNSEWQRDLWIANCRLAELAERRKRPEEALVYWRETLAILDGIKKSGAFVSPDDRKSREEIAKKIAAAAK